jgi:hypothetical protein
MENKGLDPANVADRKEQESTNGNDPHPMYIIAYAVVGILVTLVCNKMYPELFKCIRIETLCTSANFQASIVIFWVSVVLWPATAFFGFLPRLAAVLVNL